MKNLLDNDSDGKQTKEFTRFGQFVSWTTLVAFGFGGVEILAFVLFRNHQIGAAGAVTIGYGSCLLVARELLRRGRMKAAVAISCAGLLVGIVLVALMLPMAIPALTILPLVVVALALPYLQGQDFRLLTLASWGVGIFVAVLSDVLAPQSEIPIWFSTIFRIGSIVTALGLAFLLMWQFTSRLNDTLAQTRAINAELQNEVTERKQAEDELKRSNTELEQFAYVASHDLQEPLRAVAGMVQLLGQRYKGKLDERADEYIGHAVEASTRMQSLINDLLDYSRVDRHGRPFSPTNMERTLDNALANLQSSILESGAQIRRGPLPTVMADASQLTRVFQNLIGNAIKFQGARPPEIHVNAEKLENGWRFAIRDNGIGIESKYFDRIFLVFQRLHTRREYSGTGIGLSLCKKIIERHQGQIWVESELEKGSTFYFTIPERQS